MKYFLIVITGVLAACGQLFWNNKKRVKKIFLVLLFFMVVLQILNGVNEDRRAKYSKNNGKLNSKLRMDGVSPAIVLCRSQFIWNGQNGSPIFQLGDDSVTVRMKNGKALFSMIIRDREGNVLANIVDNEWVVAIERVFDWNFSDDALEIIDKKNDVLLQVELRGNSVRLAGKTYFKNGGGPVTFGPLLTACDRGIDGTIFQYPRDRHPGERKRYSSYLTK